MKDLAYTIFGIAIGIVAGYFMRGKKKHKPQLQFTYFGNDFINIKSINMAVVFKPNQFANFQVAPVKKNGSPATVEPGTVEYSSPDPSVIVEEDPTDETKFKVTTSADEVTESKTVDISVSADADLGAGVKTIEGILTIVVEPDGAVGFGITTLTEPADVV